MYYKQLKVVFKLQSWKKLLGLLVSDSLIASLLLKSPPSPKYNVFNRLLANQSILFCNIDMGGGV